MAEYKGLELRSKVDADGTLTLSLDEVAIALLCDPAIRKQVEAEGMVATLPHPTLGTYRGFAQPWVYSRTPGPLPFASPTLGQHNEQARGQSDD